MPFLYARKLNMTQVFTDDGKVIPVTVLEVPKMQITQIKSEDKDGYKAVQVSAGKARKEFRVEDPAQFSIDQEVKLEDFIPGMIVNIHGAAKGRGFAGAVKRHGFHGAPATHGHDHPRAVGSIGQRFPQHTRKGLRMAGRMGNNQAAIKNSMIIAIDAENRLLTVKGGVPGARGSWVEVIGTGKQKELGALASYKIKVEEKAESNKPEQPEVAEQKVSTEEASKSE